MKWIDINDRFPNELDIEENGIGYDDRFLCLIGSINGTKRMALLTYYPKQKVFYSDIHKVTPVKWCIIK